MSSDRNAYWAVHKWAARYIPSKVCEHCGEDGSHRILHHANVSGKYLTGRYYVVSVMELLIIGAKLTEL